MKNGKLGLYLEQRQDVVIKDPSRINYCSAQNSFKMALVITVAADVEPDQVLPEKEVDLRSSSLSDYGSCSSDISFSYPGELLSDDEFTEEFSSSCNSSRRSSKDVPRASSASAVLQCAGNIPLPPPPPPLGGNMISIIRIPTPPPPPLPMISRRSSISFDDPFSGLECDHGSLFTGYCPNPNCMHSYTGHDELYGDMDNSPQFESDADCIVCFSEVASHTNTRKCCSQVVCKTCIKEIVRTSVEDEGKVHILCPNPECKDGVITTDEILANISGGTKERFDKLRQKENESNSCKTCPNCCFLTEHKVPRRFGRHRAEDVIITCSKCQFEWCFRCHAPWHPSITCKQFQKGNKPFRKWTKARTGGVANCQKCPLCRVYIQRSTGCNHMTCNRCNAEFCYQCGGIYASIPGIGNHYTNTSVLGCTKIYKPDQPIQRKAVRGGYLAAKLAMLTGYPVLFVAGVAVAILVGAVALPVYGGYRYYKFKKKTNQLYRHRRRAF